MTTTIRLVLFGILVAILTYNYLVTSSQNKLVDVHDGDAIVVTGSHTGIGKHAALTLAKTGYTVFACVRKPEHGNELLEEAKKYKIDETKLKPILMDVTNSEQIEAAVETVAEFVGDRGLYGLFNNAGIFPSNDIHGNSVEYGPMEDARRTFEINYFGLLQTTKAFLPLIRRRKGRIVNNSSVLGFVAGSFVSAYASSKFAVEALSDSLRRELHPHGVFVSVVEPGFIKTRLLQVSIEEYQPQCVYAKVEIRKRRHFAKGALLTGMSPRLTTSAAVMHAMMRAVQPKTRYVVGGMSTFLRLLAYVPDTWADFVLRTGEGLSVIADDEIHLLREMVTDEKFEF
jgi:NAD(P)-dependent dehydrogenase (short-subunit alcohol dehydrogenase family)